jgi:hypothetical protein
MRRAHQSLLLRNAATVAVRLDGALRQQVRSDRYRGRATTPPERLDATDRTRFSATRAALDQAAGLGVRIADPALLRRETFEFATVLGVGGVDNPAVRAVRLLHETVPVAADRMERASIIADLTPVGAAAEDLWDLVRRAAVHLAHDAIGDRHHSVKISAQMAAAYDRFGWRFDRLVDQMAPLAVLAAVHTRAESHPWSRFETTVRIIDQCLASTPGTVDVWRDSPTIWDGRFVDTMGLLHLEVAAHSAVAATVGLPAADRLDVWHEHVRPLTWVNTVFRRLSGFGADIGELFLLPTEPRPEFARARSDGDLLATEVIRRLIRLGVDVLDDPVEMWAWQNLWARGCRPQASLPTLDELLPFDDDQWRVLVLAAHSKTGLIVDYVLGPVAQLVGWSPDACPRFARSPEHHAGVDATRVAESACRRVRHAWDALRVSEPLPALPDRLAYMTRKVMALWLAQRVPTAVLTRWLSHADASTNFTYVRGTVGQVLAVRERQTQERR